MALTPEQIQQLISGFQGMTPDMLSQSGGMYKDATGQGIQANYAGRYDPMVGDYVAGQPTEYMVSGPGATRAASSPFDVYNTQGEYTRSGNYAPATNINKEFLKYAAALAATGAAGGMFGGGGGAGGGLGAGTNPGVFNAAMDSQLANAALGGDALAGYGAAGAGGVTASPIAAAGGGSGISSSLSGLLPEGLKGYLGPAATLVGGLLGSKPQTQSATTTRTTDPRFDPAINGLLGMLQAQIGQTPAKSTLGNITPASNPFTRKR